MSILFCLDLPKRFNIAVMLFTICFLAYMARVNLSINIVAMTVPLKNDSKPVEDYGPRYNWDEYDQAILLLSYFIGYLMTSIPGGMLAERFGGKSVAGYCSFVFAALTALTPLAAEWGVWPVFVVRFVIGLFSGVIYPCCHNLVSKWGPPQEKGKFIAALMGGTFGTVITWPLSGLIIENMGWKWAFYLEALFIGVGTVVWFIVVADSPAQHSTISSEELELIQKSLGDTVSSEKKWPPFKDVATSLPFWSLLWLHYGSMWGLYFLITAAPKFTKEVLEFDIASAGFMSSAPHLARLLCAFGFGALADLIRRKQWLTVTQLRKYFCVSSHILPGAFLIIMAFFGRTPYICVAIMTFSLGFNGAATVTNLANSQDLAPNYAGTLYGTINGFGTTPGIFSPLIVALFTSDKTVDPFKQWQYIFLIGAGAYITPAIFFWIFGSGEIQYWNEIDKKSNRSEANTKL